MREKGLNEKKKTLLLAAGLICILIVGSVAAYFTGTDEASNVFTVGSVDITLSEDAWKSSEHDAVVPNQVIPKDPTITNNSEKNDAYVFLRVTVPSRSVKTAKLLTGETNVGSDWQELFQINSLEEVSASWKGPVTKGRYHTFNDNWILMNSTYDEEAQETVNILAYIESMSGDKPACKALGAGESTTAFNSVTFANVLEGQGLENTDLNVRVEAFAIQTTNVGGTGTAAKTVASDVWNILEEQIDTNGLDNGNALSEKIKQENE